MNALVYLLGARALGVARDSSARQKAVSEASLGPLASTPETAAAWRRWAQGHDTAATEVHGAEPSQLPVSGPRTPQGSPA